MRSKIDDRLRIERLQTVAFYDIVEREAPKKAVVPKRLNFRGYL